MDEPKHPTIYDDPNNGFQFACYRCVHLIEGPALLEPGNRWRHLCRHDCHRVSGFFIHLRCKLQALAGVHR